MQEISANAQEDTRAVYNGLMVLNERLRTLFFYKFIKIAFSIMLPFGSVYIGFCEATMPGDKSHYHRLFGELRLPVRVTNDMPQNKAL